MTTVYEVRSDELIQTVAEDLKENVGLEKPQWADFVKTGAHKERQPDNKDWWYMRVASVLRNIYLRGPVGVQRLRKLYGGRKNKGHNPEKFYKGSGKILRVILQQLDEEGFTKKEDDGRVITPKGQSYLDKFSSEIAQNQ